MGHIGAVIELNEGEQKISKGLAKLRFSNNRKDGVTNSKIGKQSDEFTDLEGIASELAFCKLFNIMPDFSIQVRSSDKNQDFGDSILPNGKSVDVKSTKYKNGKLVAVPWKKKSTDYFALMVGEFPTYIFKGFMKSEELLDQNRLGDLGHGPTYIAKQEELKELTDL